MKVIICGAGSVGMSIATYLEQGNNDIIVIDHNEDLLHSIGERHDIQTLLGHASDPNILKLAQADQTNVIIAVTPHDELNMMVCEVASALYNIPTKIARIRNQAYLHPQWKNIFSPDKLSIDVVISPEVEIAHLISRGFTVPGAFVARPLAQERLILIGTKCLPETPIVNTPISHICGIFPHLELSIAAIWRHGSLILPSTRERLLAGDDIYLLCRQRDTTEVMKAFGYYHQEKRRLLILGGGKIGCRLAEDIERHCPDTVIRIIEKDKQRCQHVSQKLKKSVVIEGDALDIDILKEADVDTIDTVIGVTDDDQVNTLGTLLAKYHEAKRGISLINSFSSLALVHSLGVDNVINPRMVTLSNILHHIRRAHVHNVFTLPDSAHEVIEVSIHENSTLSGSTIENFEVAGDLHVISVVRGEKVYFPPIDLTFERGDRVILGVANQWLQEIERLFFAKYT